MATDTVRKIRFDVDDSELKRLISTYKDQQREERVLNDLIQFRDKILNKEIRTIQEVQEAFGRLSDDAQDGVIALIDKMDKLEARAKKVGDAFGETDGKGGKGINVGNIGTGLSQIGSATGIGAVGDVAGLFDAAEGLGQLKEAASGLPSSIGSVVSAIGVGGAVVGGTLIAVLAAAAIGIKLFADSVDRYTGEIADRAEGRLRVTDDIINGLTTKQAEERVKKLKERMEAYNEVLESTQKDYEELLKEAGGNPISDALTKQFSENEERIIKVIEDTKAEIKKAQEDVGAYNIAIKEGRLATNDRTAAEKELSEVQKEITSQTETRIKAETKLVEATTQVSKALSFTTGKIKGITEPITVGSVLGRPTIPRAGGSTGSTVPTRESEPSTIFADIAKIRAGANEDLFQLRERFFNEEREALIQHEQDKARILSDFAFDNQNALYDRDARASRQLQNQRDKNLNDLSQDLENTLRVLNTNLAQEQAQIQRQLSQQIQERYAEETRAVNTITQAVNNLSTASARLLSVSQQNINAAVANSLAKVFG